MIGRRQSSANVRWANNTVTTNGAVEEESLSIVSIVGRRVASVTRTYFPWDQLESMVRESEAACEGRPEAPDFMPLLDGDGQPADWAAPPVATDIHVFDRFAPKLAAMFARGRAEAIHTFGYAEHRATTTWLATSTGLHRRHGDRIGKIDVTAKSPDFSRSSWSGAVSRDFSDVEPDALLTRMAQRLTWSERRIQLPAGQYEVLLEPSCTGDLALAAYYYMTRRDADEGQSPYAKPGGGTRMGERLFGSISMYSDPDDIDIPAPAFHSGVSSSGMASVFDNGLPVRRTDWVRHGALQALFTPRYWGAKVGAAEPIPPVDNLIVRGDGPDMEGLMAETRRALLVTCLWYVRTVDLQTALLTGLTRDGVFLVEDGEVIGAVNNFRWNMSPIAALAQASEIGRSGVALPREYDDFLRVKAPPVRIERFNMSSVSDAT